MTVKIFKVKFILILVSMSMHDLLRAQDTTVDESIHLPGESSMIAWRGLQAKTFYYHLVGQVVKGARLQLIIFRVKGPIVTKVMIVDKMRLRWRPTLKVIILLLR